MIEAVNRLAEPFPPPRSPAPDVLPGAFEFARPANLAAHEPPEARGAARDEVRLLVSDGRGHRTGPFRRFAEQLEPGDLVVVNRSATIPASMRAVAAFGPFRLNLSTQYGSRVWLTEPRANHADPGDVPVAPGMTAALIADASPGTRLGLRFVAPHPGVPRLWFAHFDGDALGFARVHGEPVRYGYVAAPHPLERYQTMFGDRPGSAEMPSAGRPFTARTLATLRERGVAIARITLHTGLSAPERGLELLAEPFDVPPETAAAIGATRERGGRVVAIGTTVVRALASAVGADGSVRPAAGFTRVVVSPGGAPPPVDALLTGFHDPGASHLAMLSAVAGEDRVRVGYRTALAERLRWHEFGDVHLLFAPGR